MIDTLHPSGLHSPVVQLARLYLYEIEEIDDRRRGLLVTQSPKGTYLLLSKRPKEWA